MRSRSATSTTDQPPSVHGRLHGGHGGVIHRSGAAVVTGRTFAAVMHAIEEWRRCWPAHHIDSQTHPRRHVAARARWTIRALVPVGEGGRAEARRGR